MASFEDAAPTDPAKDEGFIEDSGTYGYGINFENDTTTTAQTVTLTEQLDSSLDWSTFQFGDIGFGSFSISVPTGRTSYSTQIDATATLGVYVDVTANLNLQTGLVTWTFTALDPTTLDLPIDPTEGVLAPGGNSFQAQGFVTYTVGPKANLAEGTHITSQATVTLNNSTNFQTPALYNDIDSTPPTSSVSSLPTTESSPDFTVSWSGSQPNGPGIASYNVYVSDNGGAYTLWQSNTTQTSATYDGVNGHTYAFYSVAADALGLVQATPTSAQATTMVAATPPTSSVSALPADSPGSFTVSWSGSAAQGLTVASYSVYVSDNGGAFTALLTNTTQTSTTFTGANGHTYGFYSVATDNTGDVQPTPTSAQATTTVLSTPPTSTVSVLPSFSPGSFTLNWSGSAANDLSVASYSVYVSDNGGAFTPLLTNTTQTSTIFSGINGHTYAFYSVATDSLGNVQATPTNAQATTTVDTAAPTSSVSSLATVENTTSFTVSWSGSDNNGGSGLADYSVYVSDNGGVFTPLLTDTTLTSTTFLGVNGHTYGFYTLATDKVGNVQSTPTTAQATTTVDSVPPTSSVNALPPTVSTPSFTVSWSGSDPGGPGIAPFTIYVSDNGGIFTPWLTNTTQTSATYSGQVGHTYGFSSVAIDVLGLSQPTPTSAQATTHVSVPQPPLPPPAPLPAPVPSTPPAPTAPQSLQEPPFLALIDAIFGGGVETVNSDGSVTITDSFFGIPIVLATFNSFGSLTDINVFGVDLYLFDILEMVS